MGNRPSLVPELGCQDVLTGLRFYTDVLGLHVRYDRPGHGFYYLERQGAEITIEQLDKDSWLAAKAERPFGQGMHFQIETTDLATLYKTCKAQGGIIYRDWEEAWYRSDYYYLGQIQFIVSNPDGYLLRFEQELGKHKDPKTGRIIG